MGLYDRRCAGWFNFAKLGIVAQTPYSQHPNTEHVLPKWLFVNWTIGRYIPALVNRGESDYDISNVGVQPHTAIQIKVVEFGSRSAISIVLGPSLY